MRKSADRKRLPVLALITLLALTACGTGDTDMLSREADEAAGHTESAGQTAVSLSPDDHWDEFVLIQGGAFQMGSPADEAWREDDELQHTATVSDFYMGRYEVTQREYQESMGENPSNFSGEELPVESITWLEAIDYCNARSEGEGLTPVYTVEGGSVSWNRAADGYRLPTEAEWEYACRAGTETPFNTETSIGPEQSNYYGHYPYEIEDNYFSQGSLETTPGEYRQTTVAVDSFRPNSWGLYNMHGNVGEWCWDSYGAYETAAQENPAGPTEGTRRVYRGGGWNDFAKNMRSAYRAAMPRDRSSHSVGIRLVRGSVGEGIVAGSATQDAQVSGDSRILIAYFSWGGNTRSVARTIQEQTGADLFEMELATPYSSDYSTVLDEAQRDQNNQARPELANRVNNMDGYDVILLGYPNWWASIPMPIATFLEEYDFTGKTIVPFCSHGGGRFGQSLTAIAKLAPGAAIAEGLAVSYSGGSGLPEEVAAWLAGNGIVGQ